MPEFVKYADAGGFFPGQCFTCATHEGPFYMLGDAAGYGSVLIHPQCVIELARYEGMVDLPVMEELAGALRTAETRVQELEREVAAERERQVRVVPLADALKKIKTTPRTPKKEASNAVASGEA